MYYITEDFKQLIRNLGGEWNDQKKRPIVCLMQSTEHPDLYILGNPCWESQS